MIGALGGETAYYQPPDPAEEVTMNRDCDECDWEGNAEGYEEGDAFVWVCPNCYAPHQDDLARERAEYEADQAYDRARDAAAENHPY